MKRLRLSLFLFVVTATANLSAAQAAVKIANDALAIAINATNGALLEFKDLHSGQNFASAAGTDVLWQIDFPSGQNLSPWTPNAARTFRVEEAKQGADAALKLTWSDFGFSNTPKFSVEVIVSLEAKRPMSAWRMRFTGLGGPGPDSVHFPRLANIPRQENENLAVPIWLGQHTAEPRKVFSSPGKASRNDWPYPGQLSLQCLAFYAPGGAGLYVSCDDTNALPKSFAFFGDGGGNVGCDLVHLPHYSGGGTNWTMPYQAVLGTFAGDWITAAERYREWGTNQHWARDSRLKLGEVPDWVLKTGMWVWNRGRSPGVLPPALALEEKLGLPVSVFWHWWHGCSYDTGFPEYLPPREGTGPFTNALQAAHTKDIHALVYMNQRLWGTTTKSWTNENAEPFAVKDRQGKTFIETYNTFTKAPCASMCLGTEFWRRKYASLSERAVRELGVDGIYMDQACASLVCYDAMHGHAVGAGNYWMAGFRALTKEIRARCGGSPLVLAGEGCGEAWLPWLDLMLCLQVSKERYAAPDGWEPIPFFQAVYHPYAVTYGNYSSLTMPPYDDLWPAEFAPKEPLKLLDRKFSRQFLQEQARAFVWGQQPTVANFLPDQLEQRQEETAYMMRLARVRSRGLKYLLSGTFLRPPELHAPADTLEMSRLSIYAGQKEGLKSFQKKYPLALAGAWRAPDGDVAVALASIASDALTLSLDLDRSYYDLPKAGKIFRSDETGRREIGKLSAKGDPIQLTLPGSGACLLEFVADR